MLYTLVEPIKALNCSREMILPKSLFRHHILGILFILVLIIFCRCCNYYCLLILLCNVVPVLAPYLVKKFPKAQDDLDILFLSCRPKPTQCFSKMRIYKMCVCVGGGVWKVHNKCRRVYALKRFNPLFKPEQGNYTR